MGFGRVQGVPAPSGEPPEGTRSGKLAERGRRPTSPCVGRLHLPSPPLHPKAVKSDMETTVVGVLTCLRLHVLKRLIFTIYKQ